MKAEDFKGSGGRGGGSVAQSSGDIDADVTIHQNGCLRI